MASPLSSLPRNQLTALLAASLILEEAAVYSVGTNFWDSLGWIGGSVEWIIFCLFLLPVLLMAPVAIWADKQVGRERLIATGLWLVGGSMLVVHIIPTIGALALAVGNAMFFPSALLSLSMLLFQKDGRTDAGFTGAWSCTWLASIFVMPILVDFGGSFLPRMLLMVLLVGAGFLMWFNRTGLRAGEPPAVPKPGKKNNPIGIQVLLAGAAGWGIWIVLQIVGTVLESQPLQWLLAIGLVAGGMFLYWSQNKGGRPFWFQLATAFIVLFSLLQSNVNVLSSSSGYDFMYDFQFWAWEPFLIAKLPFLLGMGVVFGFVKWGPESLRGEGSILVRLLGSVLLMGLMGTLLSGSGWMPPVWMVMFLQGFAMTLSIPLALMFIWRHAPVSFKTASVGLGFLLMRFASSGQENLVDAMDYSGIPKLDALQTVNGIAFAAALLLAASMLLLWVRGKRA